MEPRICPKCCKARADRRAGHESRLSAAHAEFGRIGPPERWLKLSGDRSKVSGRLVAG